MRPNRPCLLRGVNIQINRLFQTRTNRLWRREYSVRDRVHFGGGVFGGVLGDGVDLHFYSARAEGYLELVADLDLVGRARDLSVGSDPSRVAGLVGDRAALDKARHLQKFVKTHITSSLKK